MNDADDPEVLKVIKDFLELGHADSIAAMFRKDKSLYAVTGELLRDERFAIRLGTIWKWGRTKSIG